jgi:carboxylesterase type B
LLWVRKNAKALNIDPKRITVGGYSAGSAAVGMLTVSEHTRGQSQSFVFPIYILFLDLFAQAIQMSGSPFAEWATSNKVVSLTEKLAKHFECDSQSSVSVKRCLRKKSFKELFDGFINHVSLS